MGKIGLGRRMDTSRLKLFVMVESTFVPGGRLQAGGSEHSAKQKPFGTVLARAPSPAFYSVLKKPHCLMGGFFVTRKAERGEVGRRVLQKQGESAKAVCFLNY